MHPSDFNSALSLVAREVATECAAQVCLASGALHPRPPQEIALAAEAVVRSRIFIHPGMFAMEREKLLRTLRREARHVRLTALHTIGEMVYGDVARNLFKSAARKAAENAAGQEIPLLPLVTRLGVAFQWMGQNYGLHGGAVALGVRPIYRHAQHFAGPALLMAWRVRKEVPRRGVHEELQRLGARVGRFRCAYRDGTPAGDRAEVALFDPSTLRGIVLEQVSADLGVVPHALRKTL